MTPAPPALAAPAARPAGSGPRRARRPLRRPVVPALLALLVALAAAAPAAAFPVPPYFGPPTGFGAAETAELRYFVEDGAAMDAEAFAIAYGEAAERAVAEIGTLFPPPDERIELYVYGTDEAFLNATQQAARPEAAEAAAVADPGPGGGDAAVALPRLQTRSPLEAENALRHALAHVLIRDASAGRLPRGFDEGFARYAERPVSARLARGAALLQNALQRDGLLSWSELNRPQPPNADPDLVAAHAYGIVAFLVERHGLRPFRDFVTALAAEPDWRAAMRTVYKRGPGELEEQWRADLPRWTAGGWRDNLFAAFDLRPAQELLAKAHYAAAKLELERSLRLYTDLDDAMMRAEVERLLRQGDVGLQAEALMGQIQEALERHTYDRAGTLVAQARAQYDQLPAEQRPADLLGTYDALAAAGLGAAGDLETARRLAHRWADYPEARAAALAAGSTFAQLGDEEQAEGARDELRALDVRQRRLVLMLGALAALTIAWLALWLWARGRPDLHWGRA